MQSLLPSLGRWPVAALIGMVLAFAAGGTEAAPLQTQISANVNLVTPLSVQTPNDGGTPTSLGSRFVKTPGDNPVSVAASDASGSGSAGFVFTTGPFATLEGLPDVNSFQVKSQSSNVVNPFVPEVSVPTFENSRTTFLSFDT